MSYNWNVTITVPGDLSEIARKIGMALDPDKGGGLSFGRVIDWYTEDGEPIYGPNIVASTPCQKEFFDQVPVLLANPAMLHAIVSQDYATRWPDEKPPTLAECESFCKSVIPEPESVEVMAGP